MMSKKQWVALLTVFMAYLLMGAGVFYSIEYPLEQKRRLDEKNERRIILSLVQKYYKSNESELLDEMSRYCGRPISTEEYVIEDMGPELWTFYNSFFFVITVVSTIGYGNLAPTAMLSRILMILYALVGIPMNGILLASLAEFFSNTLVRARARHKHHSIAMMLGDFLRYLLPGAVVFLLLPAALFMYVEDWSYDKAVYYAFVTLTTIGFGDIVAGQTSRDEDGPYLAYRVALVVWIVFGLGYLLMLLGLISRAMRGKRVARLEHALAEQLRSAEKRVTKDLRYVRRVLNELYLQKLKPVYRDEDASSASGLRARSCSEPSLAGVLAASPRPRRARVCSEGAPFGHASSSDDDEPLKTKAGRLVRTASDSALSRIDRAATFATPAAAVAPARLLARFVSALAPPPPQHAFQEGEGLEGGAPGEAAVGGGVHGFADADILRSERQQQQNGSRWWTVGPGGGALDGLAPLPRGGGGWPAPPPAYSEDSPSAAPRARTPHGVRYANGYNVATAGGRRSVDAAARAEWTWSAPFAASQLVHGLERARQAGSKSCGGGGNKKKASEAAAAAAEAEAAAAAAGGGAAVFWPNGVGASPLPPGRRGKRQSIAAVALSHLSKWNPLRRGRGGSSEQDDEENNWSTWAPGRKPPLPPASPPPRPRGKAKSVADVFFFQRRPDDVQEEAEARVDALLEGTSLADLFRAVDALRRRDAVARAQRGDPPAAESPSASTTSSSCASSESGGSPGRRGGRRKLGTANLTPPYASLTSLFVPPSERKPSVPSVHSLASSRRRSASPAALAFALGGLSTATQSSVSPEPRGGDRRRPSLRHGASAAARAAAFFQRRPSAPQAAAAFPSTASPHGSLPSLASAPSPAAAHRGVAQLQLRRGSLRPPSPANDTAAPQATAYFKRGVRRFSVRPVPPSALATIPSAATSPTATSPVPSEPPSPPAGSGDPPPPPVPAPPPAPPLSASSVTMLPGRLRDLRTQLLQRQFSDSGLPAGPQQQRPRRNSLRDVVIHKP